MEIQLFEAREDQILTSLTASVKLLDTRLYETCRNFEEDLKDLSRIFSHYPSILDQRSFGSEVHSIETLIEILYRDGCNHTVLLPTKIVVGRSFMVAKFNYLGFLLKLIDRHHELTGFREDIQRSWEMVIFSLLIEDVYQVIIERDGYYPTDLRRQAAVDLIYLWEYRFDRNVSSYTPNLVDLWRVRKRIAPVFGTMLGTVELMKLSSLLSDRWHQFLISMGDEREVIQALEEFIFGLTFEQITSVRRNMQIQHRSVIGRDELGKLTGTSGYLEELTSIDPRAMYRFYQRRARQILKRTYGDIPGPRRTLEEILLVYLIEDKLTDTAGKDC